MLPRILLFSACLLLFAACRQNNAGHLSKEEMQKVMLDVQLAEVYSTMAGKDSAQSQGLKNNDSLATFYKQVLKHHGLTAAQFRQNLDWYREHPDDLDSVFNRSLNTLEKIERKP